MFYKLYLTLLLLTSLVAQSCMSAEGAEAAFITAGYNKQLTEDRNDQDRERTIAFDARQREALDIQLDLTSQLGESEATAKFERSLAALTITTESRPTPEALAGGASKLRAATEAFVEDCKATRAKVAATRAEVTARLNRELAIWLDDPKARQQLRIADILAVYAKQQSETARYIEELWGKTGIGAVK